MAKKKRRITEAPKEEYEFVPEDFDEREFIYKDIYGTKVLLVIAILAVIVGAIGAVICNYSNSLWLLATAISFLTVFAMKKILKLMGFRADLLDSKTMYGNYFVFLCLALGVCVVCMNAPFV
ncbi:MAG: hypothetical protein KA502_00295 [Candidatus Methanomethylophilaceae archaeon]|nr:hypothetical protein [Candidatus Methanomethylophilaceae archaeon]